MNVKTLAYALSSTLALGAFAADYTVSEGNSLDDVIREAKKGDNIYVGPGTYTSSTQWGANVLGNLIGTGATRDDVVIRSTGSYRTLRLADGGRIENVTIVGEGTYKADKGGAVEVNGGTITNCVITGGTAYGNDNKNAGGNLYLNSNNALVVDCVISGGKSKNRGGNVCIDHGTVRNCTISGGSIPEKLNDDAEQHGGNVWIYQGNLENCEVTGGSAERAGNVYVHNSISVVKGCTISGGTVSNYGGNVFLRDGKLQDCELSESLATNNGGSVYMQAGSIVGCTISKGSGKEGGAIYMTGGTLKDSTVYANGTTKGSGGGVYMDGSGATIDGCVIDGKNGVLSYHGGCIYMKSGTVKDTTCQNGVARSGGDRSGGNIYMEDGTLTNVTLKNGDAIWRGGNLYVKDGAITGLVCESGKAGSDGGNVFATGSTIISDSILKDGSGVSDGDAKGANIYLDSSVNLIRCQVLGGTSFKLDGTTPGYDRGSVCAYSSSAVIDNCLVSGSACGGILYGAAAKTYNTTIVANKKYGVWCWGGGGQTFINTVVFGNTNEGSACDWTGDQPSAVERLLNCAVASGTVADRFTTTVIIDESAFVDFASGDYRPTRTSALTNAGATDPRGVAASTIDLLGKPRVIEMIDIGAYEYQPSGLLVTIDSVKQDHFYVPATFVFTHSSANSALPEKVKFKYDFGDGSVSELTSELTMTHVYTNPGTYTVKITAVNECEEEEAEQTYEAYVKTTSSKVYVTLGNANAAFPYDTPETGYATIADAMKDALDDYVLQLPRGVYEVAGQIDLTKKITLRGLTGKPTDVVLRNTVETPDGYKYRVLQVGLGARAENLTIENGRVKNQYGACLRVAGGTVSNCVIRAGVAVVDNGNAAGGGVCLGGQGSVITHCVISGNAVQGTSTENKDYSSGAVFIENSSKDCRISNCLIVDNVYVPSPDSTAGGTAGVRFGGRNDHTALENCTIAGNRVEGSLPDDSAGLYCTTWHSYVRNCVIAGNYETGKAKYTSAKLDFNSDSGFSYLNNLTDDTLIPESGTKSVGHRLENDHTRIFKNLQKGDYRPVPGGATVDAGTGTLAFPAEVDLLGSARIMFKAIDIGCYECQRLPGLAILIK